MALRREKWGHPLFKTKEVDIVQKLWAGKYRKKSYSPEKIGLAVKKNWRNRQFLTLNSIEGFLYDHSI